jgi:hypothetical protein
MDYYQKYLKYKDKYIKLKQLKGGDLDLPNEEQEKEIAIVCHCSPKSRIKHQQLYYINIKKKEKIQEIGNNIRYVDPLCDNKIDKDSWTKIDDNSLMYIWGINCMIHASYLRKDIIEDILWFSLRRLKLDGKVLFPVSQLNEYESKKNTEYFFENPFPGFTFSIESIDKFPYIIGKNIQTNFEIKEYYVFTKNIIN